MVLSPMDPHSPSPATNLRFCSTDAYSVISNECEEVVQYTYCSYALPAECMCFVVLQPLGNN